MTCRIEEHTEDLLKREGIKERLEFGEMLVILDALERGLGFFLVFSRASRMLRETQARFPGM